MLPSYRHFTDPGTVVAAAAASTAVHAVNRRGANLQQLPGCHSGPQGHQRSISGALASAREARMRSLQSLAGLDRRPGSKRRMNPGPRFVLVGSDALSSMLSYYYCI